MFFTKGKGFKLKEYDFIPTSKSWLKDKRNKNPKPFTYIYPNFLPKDLIKANTKTTKINGSKTNRHPCEKNVKLIEFFISISTNKNDIVLDCFMGSGTTGLACKNLNRRFTGCDNVKEYYEIAKRRLNNENI